MDDRALSAHAEAGWARRLQAGDESVLAEIYDRYSSLVYGLALKVTGNPSAAEDVAQEVFVTLWERPERFDPARGTMRAYLGTLTHRRAVDLIRREEARKRRETRTTAEPEVSTDMADLALRSVACQQVRAAVASLPDAQREAVELAYYQGRTYRQVAADLGIPEGTAKSRLRLALGRVAELVTPDVSERWA
jgi:RNA polymerase sigma-70 factor (ECF subfamily)